MRRLAAWGRRWRALWRLALAAGLAGLALPVLAQGDGMPVARGVRVAGGMGGVTRAMAALPDGVLLVEGDALLRLNESGVTLRRVLPGRGQAHDLAVRGEMVYLLTEQGLALLGLADLAERGFIAGGGQALAVTDAAVYVAAREAGIRMAAIDRRDGLAGPWRAIPTPAAARDLVADPAGRALYAALGEGGVSLYDLRDPAQPQLVSLLAEAAPAGALAIEAGRLLVGCGHRLLIYDLADPLQPRALSAYDPLHDPADILLRHEWAYIADRAGGLKRYSIGDLEAPRWEDVIWPGAVHALADDGRYVYAAAGWDGVLAFDAGRPDILTLRARAILPGQATAIALGGDAAGRRAVAGMAEAGIAVIDWRDADRPVVQATLDLGGTVQDVAVRETIGLAALAEGEVALFSLARPDLPRILARVPLGGTPRGIALDGALAYIAAGEAGLYVLDTSRPLAPIVLGHLPPAREDLAAVGVTLEGGKRLYLSAGAALMIVDVDSPDDPQLLAVLPIPAGAAAARNFIVYAAGGPALTTINVSSSSAPEVLGRYRAAAAIRAVAGRGERVWLAGEGAGAAAVGLALDGVAAPHELATVGEEGGGAALDWTVDGTPLLAQADGALLRLAESGAVTLRAGLPAGRALTAAGDGRLLIGGEGWAVLDVAAPERPAVLQTGDAPGAVGDLATDGATVWLALGEQGILAAGEQAGRWQPDVHSGVTRALAVDGDFVYAAEDGPGSAGGLRVLTAAPPGTVTVVPLPGPGQAVDVRDGRAYVAYQEGRTGDAGGLAVIDAGTPAAGLEAVGRLALAADDLALLPGERVAYAVRGTTLAILDMSAWPEIRVAGAVTLPAAATRLALLEARYLAALQPGGSGLLLDLRDPLRPVPVAALPPGAQDVAGGSAALYSAAGEGGLWAVSLATLAGLEERLIAVDLAPATALLVAGRWLYAAGGGALRLYDLADPLAPALIVSVPLPAGEVSRLVARETRRDGRWLYMGLADGVYAAQHAAEGGLSAATRLADLSGRPLAAGGSWLYLAGAERALIAAALVDSATVRWQIAYPPAGVRPLAALAWDYRALVASGVGLVALEWAAGAAPPVILGLLGGLPATPRGVLAGADGRVWLAGEGFVWQVDARDPAAPALAWTLSVPEAGGSLALAGDGGALAVAAGSCGMRLLDVTADPPRSAGEWRDGAVDAVAAAGGFLAALGEDGLTLLQVEPDDARGLPPASAPQPPDGAVEVEGVSHLRWEPAPGRCDAWRYEVWLVVDGGPPVRLETVDGAEAVLPALPPGASVTWQVNTVGASGEVREGALWRFQTGPLTTVEAAERLALPPVEQAVTPPPDVPAAAGLDARQLLPVLIGGIVLEVVLVAGLLLWWRRGRRR